MKIRYHRHTIKSLILNSINEGLDALIDNEFELNSYTALNGVLGLRPAFIAEEVPVIEGHRFNGWIYLFADPSKRIRLYSPIRNDV